MWTASRRKSLWLYSHANKECVRVNSFYELTWFCVCVCVSGWNLIGAPFFLSVSPPINALPLETPWLHSQRDFVTSSSFSRKQDPLKKKKSFFNHFPLEEPPFHYPLFCVTCYQIGGPYSSVRTRRKMEKCRKWSMKGPLVSSLCNNFTFYWNRALLLTRVTEWLFVFLVLHGGRNRNR